MELITYDRKPFSVTAVELSFENINDVAQWCKGEVGTESTKILGTTTMLPIIVIAGLGDLRGKEFVARLGYFIVEMNGSFRVYKPKQFKENFKRRVPMVDALSSEEIREVCPDAQFTPVSERVDFGDDAA